MSKKESHLLLKQVTSINIRKFKLILINKSSEVLEGEEQRNS